MYIGEFSWGASMMYNNLLSFGECFQNANPGPLPMLSLKYS